MIRKILTVSTFWISLLATPSWAGVRSSGGGMGVVCRESDGRILSAELLDLYEARVLYGLTLPETKPSLEEELAEYLRRVRVILGDELPVSPRDIALLKGFLANAVDFVPPGTALPTTDDAGHLKAPLGGCELEQIAVFSDKSNRLAVSRELWSVLDPKNKAALIANEDVYKDFRVRGEKTSENVRRLVGRIFSTTPPPPQRFAPGGDGYHACFALPKGGGSGGAHFYVRIDPLGLDATDLRFTRISGRDTIWPVTARVPAAIDVSSLKAALIDPGAGTVEWRATGVASPFSGLVPLDGGLFHRHAVLVRYLEGRPVSITHLDGNGTLVSESEVMACFQNPAL